MKDFLPVSPDRILPFLPDRVFLSIVQDVMDTGFSALSKSQNSMHRNVIDPFAVVFEMACFGLSARNWEVGEQARQAQKTLINKVGLFHQKLIGSLDGWENMGTSGIVDVVNHDLKIIAEIKNKYNTVKQSDLIGVYKELQDMVMHKTQIYKGYTAYYVEIIPKSPARYNKYFVPSDNKTGAKTEANELIRQIDGASFYEMATECQNALYMVHCALMHAIEYFCPWFSAEDKRYMTDTFMRAYG